MPTDGCSLSAAATTAAAWLAREFAAVAACAATDEAAAMPRAGPGEAVRRRRRRTRISQESTISEPKRRSQYEPRLTTLLSTATVFAPQADNFATCNGPRPSPQTMLGPATSQETSKARRDILERWLWSGNQVAKSSGCSCRPTVAMKEVPPSASLARFGTSGSMRWALGKLAPSLPTALSNSSSNRISEPKGAGATATGLTAADAAAEGGDERPTAAGGGTGGEVDRASRACWCLWCCLCNLCWCNF
mmetsp:Transcript_44927/g.118927  ORF Transcript_44927/g.118927 Transcript_44927/m.118927 type:complete len:248 (-) Transcript_44927:42-785(-)